MEEFMSFDQLLTKIKEHPEYPYIIIDLFLVNDEEIDLWCSQHKTAAFKLGEPTHRIIRGKVAYDVPELKKYGKKVKQKLIRKLQNSTFEVHSNLRFRV